MFQHCHSCYCSCLACRCCCCVFLARNVIVYSQVDENMLRMLVIHTKRTHSHTATEMQPNECESQNNQVDFLINAQCTQRAEQHFLEATSKESQYARFILQRKNFSGCGCGCVVVVASCLVRLRFISHTFVRTFPLWDRHTAINGTNKTGSKRRWKEKCCSSNETFRN